MGKFAAPMGAFFLVCHIPPRGNPQPQVFLMPLKTPFVAPPEDEMPKIKGPFWVVLVFVYSKGAVVRI